MYQKRATLTETHDKPSEVDTTDHPKPFLGSSGNWNEHTMGQAKRRPSKKYIPVYHVEFGPRQTHQGATPVHGELLFLGIP
jgi:hypothetical protein